MNGHASTSSTTSALVQFAARTVHMRDFSFLPVGGRSSDGVTIDARPHATGTPVSGVTSLRDATKS
jgi:hypothetical protein